MKQKVRILSIHIKHNLTLFLRTTSVSPSLQKLSCITSQLQKNSLLEAEAEKTVWK